MMPIISNFPGVGEEKINHKQEVEAIAADQIRVGDVVYRVENDPYLTDKFHYLDLDRYVYTAAFSPDGKTLVLGGYFAGRAKVYSVNGTTITYISNIYANAGSTLLNSHVYTAAFSPDGTTIVLGGSFTGYAKVYSVDGTTITYISDIYANAGTTALSSNVYTAAFSPDGKTLVLGGTFTGYAKVYSVNGTTITYVSDIYADTGTTAFDKPVNTATFSPDGKTLVLGGNFIGKAKVYSVNGTTITYISDIYADAGTTALSNYVSTAAFSPDGKTLVLGGYFAGRAKVYSVNGTTITYISNIYTNAGSTLLSSDVYTAAFSPDGKTLVLVGGFTGCAKVYSVNGTTITYFSNIHSGTGTTALNGSVRTAAFSPDGKTLVLGGTFTGCAKVYSVGDTTITYISNIHSGTGTTALSGSVNTAAFSPDGKTLVLGGTFTGYAKVYSVNGTTLTYISDIYADAGSTSLNSYVYTATFSPDGKTLVLGGGDGGFSSGYAKVYSVSGTTITYISDIYADAGTTALSNYVRTAAFSPDSKTIVLGGGDGGLYTGYAKVYSANGTTITYVSDIYADAGTTALGRSIRTAAFSPDGKTLVLGGNFAGRANVYSVDGTVITYISNIYANAGSTLLSSDVYTAAFSPDGKTLVLGGYFTGRAKVYSVNSTTIAYVSDIYANAGTTALSSNVYTAAFSPDGKTLVLGGTFTGYAKVYSVNGTTITYISDIYADASMTKLNNAVNTAAISPDGKTLVLGGVFTCYATYRFVLKDGTIFIPAYFYYPVQEGKLTVTKTVALGFSKYDVIAGDVGRFTMIAAAAPSEGGV